MKPTPKQLSTIIMAALMGSSSIGLADEGATGNPLDVGVMTVTGILPDDLESVPGSFSVIDDFALEERRPFSVKEILRSVPGINVVDEDSAGLALNIGLRGLNPRRSARTLLMEDGMPLFLAPYGDPAAHYSTPLHRIQRIEVVKGSGQVLNGPQTIGGMINFVTKPVPTDGFEGSVSSTFGNNNYRELVGNIGFGGEAGGVMVDMAQRKGDGVRKDHDFDVRDYAIKGQLNLTDRQTLIAKYSHFEEDSNITETGLSRLEYAEDKFQSFSDNDEFEQKRKALQLQHIFEINDNVTLTSQAYHVDTFRRSFRQLEGENVGSEGGRSRFERCDSGSNIAGQNDADNCAGRHRPRQFEYWGLESRMAFGHKLFNQENEAIVGIRYHDERMNRKQYRGRAGADRISAMQSFGFVRNNKDRYLREQIKTDVRAISYFAQNTTHVGNWSITPGLRIEDVRMRTDVKISNWERLDYPEAKNTKSFTEVLPAFGVAWNGIDNTTIFAGVNKGFAPARPSRDLRPNPDNENIVNAKAVATDPEKSWLYELGIRSSYFTGITAEATLFYNDFDEIVVGTQNGIFQNAGKAKLAGLELAGRVDFGTIYGHANNVYLSGSYTNQFMAKFDNTQTVFNLEEFELDEGASFRKGNRLPYAPRHLLSMSLGYEHVSGFDARIGFDYVSRQHSNNANIRVEDETGKTGMIPSHTLWNATINYRAPGSPVTLFASVHNLFDKQYLVSRVDGKFAGRERQFFGGIRYDF